MAAFLTMLVLVVGFVSAAAVSKNPVVKPMWIFMAVFSVVMLLYLFAALLQK